MTKEERYAVAIKWAHLYSLEMTEQLGDWQTNEGGIVIAWENMGRDLRERWLAEAIDDSAEYKLLWDCLRHLAAYLLRNDLELPAALRLWVAGVLDGQLERPTRFPLSTFSRDVLIGLIVEWVALDSGLNATRNDGSEPLSACDAVADSLNTSYKLIEKAWGEYREPVS